MQQAGRVEPASIRLLVHACNSLLSGLFGASGWALGSLRIGAFSDGVLLSLGGRRCDGESAFVGCGLTHPFLAQIEGGDSGNIQ